MEPETIDALVGALKVGGAIVTASIAVTAAILGTGAAIIKYSERKHLVDQLVPAYENGHLNTKPTVFNIYRMTDPEKAHEYHTRSD